ncbi:MAG: 30S ribosomal protein S19 [Patescibacteria group bacterium]
MPRSIKKGIYIHPKLAKKIAAAKAANSHAAIKTWSRDSTITPDAVGLAFAVHNGKMHIEFTVTEEMIGHKFGEFSPTTKFKSHGGKLAKGK